MIVAIDGPAGSGKSTVAKLVAARKGYAFLDTGAMYRALTLACLEHGVDVLDARAVIAEVRGHKVGFAGEDDQDLHATLDGRNVAREIRTPEVDASVSAVAAVPEVREFLLGQQRAFAEGHDVVAEGRDIGTVVFPNADVKIYLDADPAVRARRRAIQAAGGNAATGDDAGVGEEAEAEALRALKARDERDSTREVAPLTMAEDATLVDTTNLTLEDTVDVICALTGINALTKDHRQEKRKKQVARERQETGRVARAVSPELRDRTPYDEKLAPMRHFHNSFDDYYDHALADYPLLTRLLYDMIGWGVFCVTKLVWPWRFEDDAAYFEWLKAQDRGTVVIMNHVSMIEPVVTVTHFWRKGLRLRAIYKEDFNRFTFMHWVFTRIGCIPVSRGTSDMKALRRAQHALERGENILIYPEGTRVRHEGDEVEAMGGFALIARMAKTGVTPMAVVGARKQHHGPTLKRRHSFIKIGKAITFGSLGVKGRKAQLEAMEARAMARVWELRDALREEHPGED